jgi:tetratricopeptide (TPR) repeat protein
VRLGVGLLVASLLCAAPVRADRAADARMNAARERFDVGKTLYDLGNYRDALREFAAGYSLVPKPQFLLNIGQCHRQLGEYTQARRVYEKFLSVTEENDRDRPSVRAVLAELIKMEEQSAQPLKPPTFDEPKPAPPPVEPAPVVVVQKQPEKKSFARRHWWIFPVAGAVVIGVAVGVGVGVGTARPDPCMGATSGCLTIGP